MSKHKVKLKVQWAAVKDGRGNVDVVFFEDHNDNVQFDLPTTHGDRVHFEAEAYHVQEWAEEFGFQYRHGTKEIDLEIEFPDGVEDEVPKVRP